MARPLPQRLIMPRKPVDEKAAKKLNARSADERFKDLVNEYFRDRPMLTRIDKSPEQVVASLNPPRGIGSAVCLKNGDPTPPVGAVQPDPGTRVPVEITEKILTFQTFLMV